MFVEVFADCRIANFLASASVKEFEEFGRSVNI